VLAQVEAANVDAASAELLDQHQVGRLGRSSTIARVRQRGEQTPAQLDVEGRDGGLRELGGLFDATRCIGLLSQLR